MELDPFKPRFISDNGAIAAVIIDNEAPIGRSTLILNALDAALEILTGIERDDDDSYSHEGFGLVRRPRVFMMVLLRTLATL